MSSDLNKPWPTLGQCFNRIFVMSLVAIVVLCLVVLVTLHGPSWLKNLPENVLSAIFFSSPLFVAAAFSVSLFPYFSAHNERRPAVAKAVSLGVLLTVPWFFLAIGLVVNFYFHLGGGK